MPQPTPISEQARHLMAVTESIRGPKRPTLRQRIASAWKDGTIALWFCCLFGGYLLFNIARGLGPVLQAHGVI